MYLRDIEAKDAPFMKEWMADEDIAKNFTFYKKKITGSEIKKFISDSKNSGDVHLAVCDENDEYLGTVSLKKIDRNEGRAEYAIALRKKAMGTGTAFFATKMILRIAFLQLRLSKVCLNVICENKRAARFYEKFGFQKNGRSEKFACIDGELKDVFWFSIKKNAFFELFDIKN